MEENPNIGSPIKEFISSLFKELEEGLKENGLIMCSESESFTKMELHAIAVNESKGEGGAKILGVGGSLSESDSKTDSQKITVFAKKIRKSDLAKEEAEIASAEAQKKYATRIALKGI